MGIEEYFILDIETTLRYDKKGKESIPWHPDNKIVYIGTLIHQNQYDLYRSTDPVYQYRILPPHYWTMVGHNLAFDLSYLLRDGYIMEYPIWDTQLAHYILTGQTHMFPSLQEVIDYWNLPYAKGSLEEFWDNDIDTFDIPRNIIEPYLLNDLGVTKEIFIRQVKQAESRKILPLLLSEMAARRATIDMEFNGMRINVLGLEEEKKSLEGQLEFYKEVIESEMLAKFGTYSEPNASSDEDISKFLYGGVVELTIREEVGVFKTGPKKGQKKYKKFKEANVVQSVLKYETFNLISEKFKDTFHKKKNGIYAVGEDVLREILKHEDRGFIRNVLQYRKLKKDISTYYQGLEKHIWVHDHVIHPKFNHCATVTGRLSSSSPNFQNISGYKGE